MDELIAAVRSGLPETIAIYLFGSAARGDDVASSDLDLALLLPRALATEARFILQERLAALVGRDVDLVDLRNASTVMRAQVLRDGKLLFESDRNARARFEMYTLADYARLNEERRAILEDARASGTILG